MNIVELFVSALTALRSNVMRTLLTMLGIIIGIASVIIIISLGEGAQASINDQISSFGANQISISPGAQQVGPTQTGTSVETLTFTDSQAIQDLPSSQITAVSASVTTRLQVVANGQNMNTTVYGIEPGYQLLQTLEIDSGSFISEDDVLSNSRIAVVGPDVVTELFGEGAEVIGETIRIDGKSFRIAGVTRAKGSSGFTNPDEAVYLPVTTAMRVLLGQQHVTSISVNAAEPDDIDGLIEELTTLLRERHEIRAGAEDDFSIQSTEDARDTVNNILNILTGLLTAVAAISLIVGGIGIMNIMLVTVTERTKEIGLLKAIGAKRKDILTQFLIESIVLTVAGGLVGMAIGIGISYLASSLINIPFVLRYTSILISIGVSSVVGIVFGIYPAQRAAKLNPIEALRFE